MTSNEPTGQHADQSDQLLDYILGADGSSEGSGGTQDSADLAAVCECATTRSLQHASQCRNSSHCGNCAGSQHSEHLKATETQNGCCGRAHCVTVEEAFQSKDILRFLLVNLMFGHSIRPATKDYWYGDSPYTPITRCMPFAMFKSLSADLHVLDTARVPAADKAERSALNCFWQLGDFLEDMSTLFADRRVLQPELTVDEFTIPFRADIARACSTLPSRASTTSRVSRATRRAPATAAGASCCIR